MDRSYKQNNYNCSRLNRLVTITIEYVHPDHNEHKVAVGYECGSDRECDIAKVDEKGIYTWERALCPAVECV